ncbi:MAG: hypothetical protein IJ193_04395, partial [Bacilli bacterium]|nr:hypothetical protein [Bacilli bacterium]
VQYTYNYDSNHSKTTDPTKVCSKTCYEAVDVEYGAPEAAVAGFAIQYQVKITSRVRCEAKIDIEAPTPPTICQPQPSCVHKSGKELTQGGPNEQFDACIQKCDGGKYSQKCSQACYNEVYNTNSTTKKTNTLNIGTVKQMKNQHIPLDQLSNGYYDRDADGNITWNAYNADEDAEYAKWYLDHNELKAGEDVRNNGKYFHFDEGFKKSSNWTFIDLCGANCTHINCAADTYLDQRRIEADYVENLKRYNAAVTDCQAAAVCSTKSSYYSMEADVEQIGKKGVQTITYPSQAKNNEKNRSCLKSLSKSDMVQATNGADSVITCYDGCYKSTAQRNNYLSEITFPGTWVNNKSGEISYSTKKREDGWHFVDGKFFTPLNAKAVNADYWRYYVALQSSTVSTKSINQEVVRNECRDYTTYEMTEENKVTTKNNGPEKYNIRANITDFGYFGWDFNVQCFYAIAEYETNTISSKDKNSTPLKCYPEPKPECTGDKCKSQEPYEIRTVAKEDLFPSSEKGGQATADTSKPGRITGFNWSDGAEIISKVQANEQGQPVVINRNYVNNPLKVLGDIQSRGVDIYGDGDSDDKTPGNNPYLDYSFYLTPKALKEIRDFGKDDAGSNYTDFTGEFKIIGGVNAYYSSLIERLNGINAVKKVGAPGCNNDNERERVCVGIDANRFGSK